MYKQKNDTLPTSTKTLPNNNQKDAKQKRQPPSQIPPSSGAANSPSTASAKNDQKPLLTNPQQTKLPFNISNELLNLNASEELNKKFAKRELVKNWDKYDKEIIEIDNEQLNAADFEKLLAAPSSIGNHFFFNSEKNWQTNSNQESDDNQITTTSLAAKYFNLNIMELTNNLQRLPFYVRQNYSTDLFTKKEIDEMNRKAALCENSNAKTVYKVDETGSKMLDILSNRREEIPKPTENVKVCQSNEEVIPSSQLEDDCKVVGEPTKSLDAVVVHHQTDSDDELEALLGLSLQPAPVKIDLSADKIINPAPSAPKIVEDNSVTSTIDEQNTGKIGDTKEDIQKWLDDILD